MAAIVLGMTRRIAFREWGVLPPEVRWGMIQNNARVGTQHNLGEEDDIFRKISGGERMKVALLNWCREHCEGFYYFDLGTSSFYFEKPSDQLHFKVSMADFVKEYST